MDYANADAANVAETPIVMKETKSCIGYFRPAPQTNRILSKLQNFFNDEKLDV